MLFLALKPSIESYPEWFWNLLISILDNNTNNDNNDVKNLLYSDLNNKAIGNIDYKYIRVKIYNYNYKTNYSTNNNHHIGKKSNQNQRLTAVELQRGKFLSDFQTR